MVPFMFNFIYKSFVEFLNFCSFWCNCYAHQTRLYAILQCKHTFCWLIYNFIAFAHPWRIWFSINIFFFKRSPQTTTFPRGRRTNVNVLLFMFPSDGGDETKALHFRKRCTKKNYLDGQGSKYFIYTVRIEPHLAEKLVMGHQHVS